MIGSEVDYVRKSRELRCGSRSLILAGEGSAGGGKTLVSNAWSPVGAVRFSGE